MSRQSTVPRQPPRLRRSPPNGKRRLRHVAGRARALGSAKKGSVDRGYQLPPTATREALVPDKTGSQFRQLIYDLLTISARMQEIRNELARLVGLTAPQYSVIMDVAHFQGHTGVSVSSVAKRLHVSGAFVTAEAGKLVRKGILRKRPNPGDGRSVLLTLTAGGRAQIEALLPHVRTAADTFFGTLDAADFAALGRIASAIVPDADQTLALLRARKPIPARARALSD